MGQIISFMPNLQDLELIFDDEETREILLMFFPSQSVDIKSAKVTNDVRRFAQTVLIAAIETTSAMDYTKGSAKAAANPMQAPRSIALKLAQTIARTWWKHTKQKDLLHTPINERVRQNIEIQLRDALQFLLLTGSLSYYQMMVYLHAVA